MKVPLSIANLGAKAMGLLNAEEAHHFTIRMLKAGFGPEISYVSPSLENRVAGIEFPNPLGLAAGFDKNAEAPDSLLGLGFGFVEVGAVTPRAQVGNPRPRVFRLRDDAAIINRYGFNNDGLDIISSRLRMRKKHGIVGINLGANKDSDDRAQDYVLGVEAIGHAVDFYTVNISSPNTPGLRALQGKVVLAELMQRVLAARDKAATGIPVFLKIAPDLTDEDKADIVDVALELQLDGLIIANTTITRDATLRSAAASEGGGLSGKPLFATSTALLREFHKALGQNIPLIGVGGVSSARDAYEKILAGASLVQLYTALVYEGPGLPSRILKELPDFLNADGFEHLRDAIGAGH